MRDSEQNDAARDAGRLLHRVKGTLQRRDRLVTAPCNKAAKRGKWPLCVMGKMKTEARTVSAANVYFRAPASQAGGGQATALGL